MLLSTFPPQTPLPTAHSNYCFTPLFPLNYHKLHPHSSCHCRATANASAQRPLCLAATASTPLREATSTSDGGDDHDSMVSSAAAVAAAIRAASTSPVDFVQSIEKGGSNGGAKNKALVLPSQDFQRLCLEQLDLFRRIVDPEALLSVYVRPAGSYVMDRLELRRITFYPGVSAADIVVLVGTFGIPAGLRVAEAAITSQQAEVFPELGAVVFPMVTHPFLVGFLVAEFPKMTLEREWDDKRDCLLSGKSFPLAHSMGRQPLDVQTFKDHSVDTQKFSTEQKQNARNITRSLAMAYVMDQKAMLLQQSSWQNNVRMNNLVEQIRGSLSSVRTLSKMLSVQLKRSEVSHDIVEDILVQGDYMKDTLQQLQDAVYLTKANITRYNKEMLKKQQSSDAHPETSSQLSNMQASSGQLSLSSTSKDSEFPMPPIALAPSHQQGIRRPCEISDVLQDLVGAIKPLAHNQRRVVELCDFSRTLKVAVDEPALRQAFSNLIEGALLRTEVGGRIEIISTGAPAGGVLIIIDDDGPDMHYMKNPGCQNFDATTNIQHAEIRKLIKHKSGLTEESIAFHDIFHMSRFISLFHMVSKVPHWKVFDTMIENLFTQMHSLTPFGADLCAEGRIEDNMTWNFIAGLTVAREILESYGCVVRVLSPRNTDGVGQGGTRVEVWLPSFSTSLSDTESLAQEA